MSEFSERYGPVALVTGASSGIGAAFAEELASRRLDLVLAARRVDRLEALAQRLEAAHGIRARVLERDLTHPSAPAELLAVTACLDVGLVVSNAGFGTKGPHEGNDPAVLGDMLMVNSHAPLLLSHGFIPRLRARGRGGLILTSSVEGLLGGPYSAAYSATKAMVDALGEALWGELADSGIDVLTLCPGATESEAAAKQGFDPAKMQNVQPSREVARLALDHLANGPTYCPSDHYRGLFERILAMPRRDALRSIAHGIRGAAQQRG